MKTDDRQNIDIIHSLNMLKLITALLTSQSNYITSILSNIKGIDAKIGAVVARANELIKRNKQLNSFLKAKVNKAIFDETINLTEKQIEEIRVILLCLMATSDDEKTINSFHTLMDIVLDDKEVYFSELNPIDVLYTAFEQLETEIKDGGNPLKLIHKFKQSLKKQNTNQDEEQHNI